MMLSLSAAVVAQAPTGVTPERVAAIADCKGRWFEAAAIVDPATKRGTRVRLCSKPNASDAEWIATLKAAAEQLRTRVMPAAPKAKLLAQIDAAIARVGQAVPPPLAPSPPVMQQPPVAVAPPPPIARATGPVPATAVGAPNIVLTCAERGQPGEGPCGLLGRTSMLVIKANSGMEDGARLRLLRRGEERGEIHLTPLRPGQSVRASLPERLCAGVNSTKVEFQLLGATGTSGQRFGPFTLRC